MSRPSDGILETLQRYWGFSELRPLQERAIRAGLEHRDSLVVLPTGGGKSLCYQVPPLVADRTDIVVSPLISLMKDQVDGLRAVGYPAAALHSGMEPAERMAAERDLAEGKLRLLFIAPERLASQRFMELVSRVEVRAFAIDEAHCISHWGHDFRPEYRQLARLRALFPNASVHAFTATATPRVREDIATQLALHDADILVGVFDRPNLVYRVLPQVDLHAQIREVVARHAGEAAIVYCLSRNDTETIASMLTRHGTDARAYHAGLPAQERARVQEAFSSEALDVVVATVAFGMGIDRSNVRCVLHATMPKSIEAYQQETGRAGRDGLAAECVLLYSAASVIRWKSLIERSAAESGEGTEQVAAQLELLRHMQALCNRPQCRHKSLSEHFGQSYEKSDCGACDVCLDEVEGMEDATETAQKILSCVARTDQRFGIGHVVDVLVGADTERVRQFGHDTLSTHGLLRSTPKKQVTSMIYQLVDQEVLGRTPGDRPVLELNEESWRVMRGERSIRLVAPRQRARSSPRSRVEAESWEGVDRDLFEHLRALRRDLAAERGVPPYVVFDDRTLRTLSAIRPTTLGAFRQVKGIGEKRATDWGQRMIDAIAAYCEEHELSTDC